MPAPIILASTSKARKSMLNLAGVTFCAVKPLIDEQSVKASLSAENAAPDEVADCLAEAKARKVSQKHPEALVIGSDQTLALDGVMFDKPPDPESALAQLGELNGKTHILYSAAVIYQNVEPIWRVTKPCRMTMRDLSDNYLKSYVDRNWAEIQYCVGAYQIEAEGVRLFSKIGGDQFSIMGLPLLEVLNQLTLIGAIDG